jgi:SAM-dependent methyltransferase
MNDVLFRRPTMARYRKLFAANPGHSVLRCLEYERLQELGLSGRVLDFGGGAHTNYSSRIASWGREPGGYQYESANIDAATEPTYLIRPGAPLPVPDGSFDAVISLNTLEHVYELESTLAQFHRVLSSGGRLVLVVPFIFRVHGHPNDYTRGTPSFWTRKLPETGFADVKVEALVWGPFSSGQSVSGIPGPLKGLRSRAALLLDVLHAARRKVAGSTISVPQDHNFVAAPLGYFIQAIKP